MTKTSKGGNVISMLSNGFGIGKLLRRYFVHPFYEARLSFAQGYVVFEIRREERRKLALSFAPIFHWLNLYSGLLKEI